MKLLGSNAHTAFQKQWNGAKNNGWTQVKIAEALGMRQPTFNQYLKGTIPLNIEFVLKFCDVLKIDPQTMGVSSVVTKPETVGISVKIRFSTSGLFFENGATRMVTTVPKNAEAVFLVEVDSEFRNIPKGAFLVCSKSQCRTGQMVVAVSSERQVVVGELKKHNNGWAVIQPLTTGDIAVPIDTSWALSKVEAISFGDDSDASEVFGA